MVDAQGFERLFRDEHHKLVAIGIGLVADSDVALELAQETLARAYARWPEVSQMDIPGAWLWRVLINLAIDRQRRLVRERSALPLLASQGQALAVEPTDDLWITAVSALPERQRAVVVLHYIEQLSIAEIAAILTVAPGTVKSSLAAARRSLRARLEKGAA